MTLLSQHISLTFLHFDNQCRSHISPATPQQHAKWLYLGGDTEFECGKRFLGCECGKPVMWMYLSWISNNRALSCQMRTVLNDNWKYRFHPAWLLPFLVPEWPPTEASFSVWHRVVKCQKSECAISSWTPGLGQGAQCFNHLWPQKWKTQQHWCQRHSTHHPGIRHCAKPGELNSRICPVLPSSHLILCSIFVLTWHVLLDVVAPTCPPSRG